jgi:hypothetical protein
MATHAPTNPDRESKPHGPKARVTGRARSSRRMGIRARPGFLSYARRHNRPPLAVALASALKANRAQPDGVPTPGCTVATEVRT